MGSKQIRLAQLIAPFGPGSMYTDRDGTPLMVGGLDLWFKDGDGKSCSAPAEFEVFEPRLSELLRVHRFRSPPDHRPLEWGKGKEQPPNAGLYLPAQRFPRWYRSTRSGEMRRFNLHTARLDRPDGGGRWQPVRFISVCGAGHIGEFPWKEWIGCDCPGEGQYFLMDSGGSELSAIRVKCRTCGSNRNLSGVTVKPDEENGESSALGNAGITCPGDRPWLGENAREEGCTRQLVGALINQTNIYFPRTASSILLPGVELEDEQVLSLRARVEESLELGILKLTWRTDRRKAAKHTRLDLEDLGIEATVDQVEEALESIFDTSTSLATGHQQPAEQESELLSFRRAEFNIIRETVDSADSYPDLRVVPAKVHEELRGLLARVRLVERLRETRVFHGFDRLGPSGTRFSDMPGAAMNQLFRDPPVTPVDCWLPAVKIYGEGIYIELDEENLSRWQENQRDWLGSRLDTIFINRLASEERTLPPQAAASLEWASRYLLVHGLAHVLINQLVFECGYSTAALRERLYVSSDPSAPMAGILIYTAAGDSEGTLGGLVRLGRSENLLRVFRRALGRATWCSADPVCSENLGGQGARLVNLAACHACILLPETSCETINNGLDRAMLVGTPENRSPGFFSSLVSRHIV